MSLREWEFSPLAFKVLWRAADRDVLPYPLQYRSTFATVGEHDEAWKVEADALHRVLDEELYGAIRVLAEPEARIEVAGTKDGDKVRVHAAAHYQHAVLLVQEPTGSPYRGGTVRLTIMAADRLPHRLVGLLPETTRGQGSGIEVSRREVEEEDQGRSLGYADADRSPRNRARHFFERPRSLVVHFAVYAGPAFDNRPAPSRGFHVMDYPDGRYVVRNSGGLIQAEPVDRAGLRTDLERVIRFTVTSHREENDPSYR